MLNSRRGMCSSRPSRALHSKPERRTAFAEPGSVQDSIEMIKTPTLPIRQDTTPIRQLVLFRSETDSFEDGHLTEGQ